MFMTVTFCPFSKASGNLTECMFGLMVGLSESRCAKTILAKPTPWSFNKITVILQILLRTQHTVNVVRGHSILDSHITILFVAYFVLSTLSECDYNTKLIIQHNFSAKFYFFFSRDSNLLHYKIYLLSISNNICLQVD